MNKRSWIFIIAIAITAMAQVGCGIGPTSRPSNEKWTSLTTLVDGVIEIQVPFPKPSRRDQGWESKTSFVGTEANESTRLFILGYDRGYGPLSGAPLVSFHGAVYRVDAEDGESPVSFDDFYLWMYADKPEVMRTRQYIGIETIAGREWHRVNYIGEWPADGPIYYHRMANSYMLSISMNVFGENADQTLLYRQRYADLQRMLASVKINIADFAER